MQQMNLFAPADNPLTCTVLPGATSSKSLKFAGHSGARATSAPFKRPTVPPPKFTTLVNVWTSPPLLVTRTVCPARMPRYAGSNLHAECPTKARLLSISGDNSAARKSPTVQSPRPNHVPAPKTVLNVMGSQSSANAILGSWLLICAPTTADSKTQTPTNTTSP